MYGGISLRTDRPAQDPVRPVHSENRRREAIEVKCALVAGLAGRSSSTEILRLTMCGKSWPVWIATRVHQCRELTKQFDAGPDRYALTAFAMSSLTSVGLLASA